MPGYIYVVRMADGVYKVGRTEQDYGLDLKRFRAYPRDATVVYVRECGPDVVSLETQILKKFREAFLKHLRGAEYFTGPSPPRDMIRIINEVMDFDSQYEFFKGLEKGPEFWTPLVFLQARFDAFCRERGWPKKALDVSTVHEARGDFLECAVVVGVK
jgi:hypothetical protein